MSDTIREQIISAIITEAANILTANGYNISLGTNVFRAVKKFDASVALVVLPQPEESERIEYGAVLNIMPVKLEGFKDESTDHSKVSEQILGDLIEFMTASTFTMAYTSGGTYEIEIGDMITGAISGSTAYVCGVSLGFGTWAGGDAAGNLTLRRKDGNFTAENLNVGANNNVATVTGTVTTVNALTRVTGSLAQDIAYVSGGVDEPSDESATTAGAYAIFNIIYETLFGNPYGQPS